MKINVVIAWLKNYITWLFTKYRDLSVSSRSIILPNLVWTTIVHYFTFLVRGKRSRHFAIPAPNFFYPRKTTYPRCIKLLSHEDISSIFCRLNPSSLLKTINNLLRSLKDRMLTTVKMRKTILRMVMMTTTLKLTVQHWKKFWTTQE